MFFYLTCSSPFHFNCQSVYIAKAAQKTWKFGISPADIFCLFSSRKVHLLFPSDHILLSYATGKAVVDDEFECQLKYIANNSCKSFNVHSGGNNSKRVCELNSKSRQMKPDDFKWQKGSTYYGFVEASGMNNWYL